MKKIAIMLALLITLTCTTGAMAQQTVPLYGLEGSAEWLIWQDLSKTSDAYHYVEWGTQGQSYRSCVIQQDQTGAILVVSFFLFKDGQINTMFTYGITGAQVRNDMENGVPYQTIRREGDTAIQIKYENGQPVSQEEIAISELEGLSLDASFVQIRDYPMEAATGNSRLIQVTVEDSLSTILMIRLGEDGSFDFYESYDDLLFNYHSGDNFFTESGDDGVYKCYGDGTAERQE